MSYPQKCLLLLLRIQCMFSVCIPVPIKAAVLSWATKWHCCAVFHHVNSFRSPSRNSQKDTLSLKKKKLLLTICPPISEAFSANESVVLCIDIHLHVCHWNAWKEAIRRQMVNVPVIVSGLNYWWRLPIFCLWLSRFRVSPHLLKYMLLAHSCIWKSCLKLFPWLYS